VGIILLASIVKITITLRCQRKHLHINTSCHATLRHDDKCLEKGKTRIMENVTAFVLSEDSSGEYTVAGLFVYCTCCVQNVIIMSTSILVIYEAKKI